MQHVTVQIHTFSLLSIDCPQTKIVTWVYEIHKVCFKKWTSHHNTPKCLSTPENVLWVHFIEVKPTNLIYTHFLEVMMLWAYEFDATLGNEFPTVKVF